MLRIDPGAINRLSPEKQGEARRLLEAYHSLLKSNPLIGYIPHPKQVIFHSSIEPLKVFLGGNRSGKTTAGILDDIIQALPREVLPEHLLPYKKWEPPFYCRVISPDFTATMEGVIFQKLREWCPANQLQGGHFDKAYDKTRRKLNFQNGSWFDFLTFEQDLDKFGGAALHRVHYDEQPPGAIRRECTMRLIDYAGDELFTMTPTIGMASWMFDEIWEAWNKGNLPEATIVVVDMDDNPHLDNKTKARALAGLSNEEREARKSGRFVSFSGMIYPEFSAKGHVLPASECWPPPENSQIIVGIDPGIRHMAAVLYAFLDPDDVMTVFEEIAVQGETTEQIIERIKRANMRYGQQEGKGGIRPLRPWAYVIDPSARNVEAQTGRSQISSYVDHGISPILGQNDVIDGINRVKERLETNRLFISANCQATIDEFRRYRWVPETKIEQDAKEKPVKIDDHLMDALRYVVASKAVARRQDPDPDVWLSPAQRAMKKDMDSAKAKEIPRTPFGGIYA